jgi:hypothetical protein
MYGRLSFAIRAHDVRSRAHAYCEALLTVRARLPKARDVFADIASRAEIGPVSTELAELMQAELNRQQGLRRSSGNVFTLVAGLIAAGAGLEAALQLELKERALARTAPPHSPPGRYQPPDTLLAFLEGL